MDFSAFLIAAATLAAFAAMCLVVAAQIGQLCAAWRALHQAPVRAPRPAYRGTGLNVTWSQTFPRPRAA